MSKCVEINNKKAYFDYFVDDTLECGIVLKGNEVKSIRDGKCNIKQSWVSIQNNQLMIRGMNIHKWESTNDFDYDGERERVLLAHKKEIKSFAQKVKEDGYTLIPLKVYFLNGRKCKVLVGLCRGKKNYDKRESIKNRDIERAIRKY